MSEGIYTEKLTVSKKRIIQNNFSNTNWYYQAFKIFANRDENEINAFITDPMIERFISHPVPFFFTWSYVKDEQNESFKRFASCILERAARSCLEKNNIHLIKLLITDKEFGSEIQSIFLNNHILTQAQMDQIIIEGTVKK